MTTLPLGRLDRYLDSLLSWRRYYKTIVIISPSDGSNYPEKVDYLRTLHVLCHELDFDSPIPSQVTPLFSPRTPSLAVLYNFLLHYIPNGQLAVFTNADISLHEGDNRKLEKLAQECTDNSHIAFLHRWDISISQPCDPQPYLEGFDAIIFPQVCLLAAPLELLKLFSIGQVGWDYGLPLMLKHSSVIRSSRIKLTHIIHPSTSTAIWDRAIILVFQNINPSHLKTSNNLPIVLSFHLLRITDALYRLILPLFDKNKHSIPKYYFFFSRTAYHCVIKRLLRRIRLV